MKRVSRKTRHAAARETLNLFEQQNWAPSINLNPVATKFEIYTDGSCWPNPGGVGGWAAIILCGGGEINRVTGSEPNSTNNRAELLAIINGISSISEGGECTVYSDSQYCVNGAQNWSKRWARNNWTHKIKGIGIQPVKNSDLWRELCALMETRHCIFKWVRGHADCYWNNECDRLANAISGIDRRKQSMY